MKELICDHDAGGKLSAGRTPLIVWFVLVTVVALVVGVVLVATHLGAGPEPIEYEAFSGYLDRMLDAFWAFGATYGLGKVAGRVDFRREGGSE